MDDAVVTQANHGMVMHVLPVGLVLLNCTVYQLGEGLGEEREEHQHYISLQSLH